MRLRLLRLALSVLAVAFAALPARASDQGDDACGCPSQITDGETACHLVSGTACTACEYNCGGPGYVTFTWCVCDLLQNCPSCQPGGGNCP